MQLTLDSIPDASSPDLSRAKEDEMSYIIEAVSKMMEDYPRRDKIALVDWVCEDVSKVLVGEDPKVAREFLRRLERELL